VLKINMLLAFPISSHYKRVDAFKMAVINCIWWLNWKKETRVS